MTDPVSLNKAGTGMESFGNWAGGVTHLLYGLQAKNAADFQAEQLRINAGQEQAAAQRDAYFADQQTKLITSRALAVAAASGGGASDPTVINIIAQDEAMGAYLKSAALYRGDDQARLMRLMADAKEYEGESALFNAGIESVGQGVKAYASSLAGQARTKSLYQRFGGSGPKVG